MANVGRSSASDVRSWPSLFRARPILGELGQPACGFHQFGAELASSGAFAERFGRVLARTQHMTAERFSLRAWGGFSEEHRTTNHRSYTADGHIFASWVASKRTTQLHARFFCATRGACMRLCMLRPISGSLRRSWRIRTTWSAFAQHWAELHQICGEFGRRADSKFARNLCRRHPQVRECNAAPREISQRPPPPNEGCLQTSRPDGPKLHWVITGKFTRSRHSLQASGGVSMCLGDATSLLASAWVFVPAFVCAQTAFCASRSAANASLILHTLAGFGGAR